MNIQRRWLQAAIAATADLDALPAMPWARATRQRPAAMMQAPVQLVRVAIAAR